MEKKLIWFALFRKVVPADYEEWLERLAMEGWNIEKIGQFDSFLMTFHKTEPKKYRYVFDLNAFPKKEYRQIYEQFGWTLVGKTASCFVWRQEYCDIRPESFTDKESLMKRNKRTKNAVLAVLIFFLAAITFLLAGIIVCLSIDRFDKILELILEGGFLSLIAIYLWWVVKKIKHNIV